VPCCRNCAHGLPCGGYVGQSDPPAWYDVRAMLDAYERTERALENLKAQRGRMRPADLAVLSDLVGAWEVLPARGVASTPAFPDRDAVWTSLQHIRAGADRLAQRIAGRQTPAPVPVPVPPPAPNPDDNGGGWTWPELPGFPQIPGFNIPNIPREYVWLAAMALAAYFLFAKRRVHR